MKKIRNDFKLSAQNPTFSPKNEWSSRNNTDWILESVWHITSICLYNCFAQIETLFTDRTIAATTSLSIDYSTCVTIHTWEKYLKCVCLPWTSVSMQFEMQLKLGASNKKYITSRRNKSDKAKYFHVFRLYMTSKGHLQMLSIYRKTNTFMQQQAPKCV